MSCFFRRHNWTLRQRTFIAQSLPADLESKISRFRQDVYHIRQNNDFSYDLICNMDETPVFFDMVPSRVVEKKGKKSVRVRSTSSEKRRVTAVLACSATGEMLPPMIIYKGKTARTIKQVKAGTDSTLVPYQVNGWMDEPQMLKWITNVWCK